MCRLGVPGVVAGSVPSISSPLAAGAGTGAGFGCGVWVPLSPTLCFGAAAEALPRSFPAPSPAAARCVPGVPARAKPGSRDDIINCVYKVTACRS